MHLDTPFIKNEKYTYKIYEIQDFPKQSIKQHFPDHFEWVNEMRAQNKKILMHCAAGISRSASFMVAYFMKLNQLPYHQALQFVKEKRKYISPNSGFRQQLK
jgi:dual specificity phosphatase 12